MADYYFPGYVTVFILAPDPNRLIEEIRKRAGSECEVHYLVWTRKPGLTGTLVNCDPLHALTMIKSLNPEPVWGWPEQTADRQIGALL
ncbi:MAG: hypothetical protein ABIK28_10670, partial [Planctomycetota bacterium]